MNNKDVSEKEKLPKISKKRKELNEFEIYVLRHGELLR